MIALGSTEGAVACLRAHSESRVQGAARSAPRVSTHFQRPEGAWRPTPARPLGGPLTEAHPVPLAERVHVAAQVVQHPGGQLVDVAGHGRAASAGGACGGLSQTPGTRLVYPGWPRPPRASPEVGGARAGHHCPSAAAGARRRPVGWT